MKGICHIWSKGRHFCLSMPGDRYLKLDSKSDHRAEISRTDHLVRRFATSKGTTFIFIFLCKSCFQGTLFIAGASFQELLLDPFEKFKTDNFLFSSNSCHFSYIVYCILNEDECEFCPFSFEKVIF